MSSTSRLQATSARARGLWATASGTSHATYQGCTVGAISSSAANITNTTRSGSTRWCSNNSSTSASASATSSLTTAAASSTPPNAVLATS